MRCLSPLLLLLASACGLRRMLPEGPVLDADDRVQEFPGATPSGVTYTGPAATDVPIIPVTVWGVTYDLDLVLVTDHPEWDMTEIARIDTSEGPVWVAKDARRSDLEQILLTDLSDRQDWMPEIPVQRVHSPVRVEDRSTDEVVDIDVFYTNADGEPVHISYQGDVPHNAQKKRNGSTMGHSSQSVIAVLDLPLRTLGRHATVRINGEEWPIRKIAGVVPFAMALTQTQAGIARTDVSWTAEPPPFPDVPPNTVHSTYAMGEDAVEQVWQVAHTATGVELVQRGRERTIRHHFLGHDAMEWTGATIQRDGRDADTFRITAHPALPDLRRPFEGKHTSDWVMDVNGQPSHAIGRMTVWWEDGAVKVDIDPKDPWWVAERPMQSVITVQDGTVRLQTERVER